MLLSEGLKKCQEELDESIKKLKEDTLHNIWKFGQVSMQSIEDSIFSRKNHSIK